MNPSQNAPRPKCAALVEYAMLLDHGERDLIEFHARIYELTVQLLDARLLASSGDFEMQGAVFEFVARDAPI